MLHNATVWLLNFFSASETAVPLLKSEVPSPPEGLPSAASTFHVCAPRGLQGAAVLRVLWKAPTASRLERLFDSEPQKASTPYWCQMFCESAKVSPSCAHLMHGPILGRRVIVSRQQIPADFLLSFFI